MQDQGSVGKLRNALTGRSASIIYRIVFGVIAFILAGEAMRSIRITEIFNVQFGTTLWFINALIAASSIIGILCILMMSRSWAWALWVWAVAALGVALIGVVVIDVDTSFATQWTVILPWSILPLAALLKSRFGMPWKGGGTQWVAAGMLATLLGLGGGVHLIHGKVAAERSTFLEPLKQNLAATNQQLPTMLNDELRLDRVYVELSAYHQVMTFPYRTVADLRADPGLDMIRGYYAETFMVMLCEMPSTAQCLTTDSSCGEFRYQFFDMDGAKVVSFSLYAANCRTRMEPDQND